MLRTLCIDRKSHLSGERKSFQSRRCNVQSSNGLASKVVEGDAFTLSKRLSVYLHFYGETLETLFAKFGSDVNRA